MAKIKYNSVYKVFGIASYYLRYKYTQFWSVKKIEKYQFKRLKRQLIKAEKTVYYKKLFNEIGFNPKKDFNKIEDITKVPITLKSNVKKNTENFVIKKYKKKALIFFTSGSTGNPMKAYIHPLHWVVEQGVIYRHWQWGGYSFYNPTAMIRSYSPKIGEPLTKYSKLLNTTYFSPFHLTEKNMFDYYNKMIDLKIEIIRGYPSSVKTFVSFLKNKNLKIPSVKQVLTASEVLTDEDRAIIEEVLDCKVSNHYGLAEQIIMMGDCENHTHLHNYFEYGYLELLNTDIENIKRIIGTNLHNKAMPLIRYDTGDLAVVDNLGCKCSRNGLVVKNIIGRNDQNITTPQGQKIPTVNFYTMMEDFIEINKWQIIYDDKTFLLKYILGDDFSDARKEILLSRLVQRIGHTGFLIELKEDIKLDQTEEGKLKIVIKK
ncbi:phenylacetate--CoA ligase family protein [Polaribacter haliotis]|uniref:Phenylacetate--CoA ligase family protein n=1 Tax=Polaribacter haliotis TaxID=1888915 RepID=A0A7L8AJC6_9FLAO|nr:phenylacetate--CoA ligase family protein [Polaribacter haliotis]QOD62073.1 phenylacetate--CoA ligase family protein [Polaribacter haliotis]